MYGGASQVTSQGIRVRHGRDGRSTIAGPVVHVTTYTEDDSARMGSGDRKRNVRVSTLAWTRVHIMWDVGRGEVLSVMCYVLADLIFFSPLFGV